MNDSDPTEENLVKAEAVLKRFDYDVIVIYQLGQRHKARTHIARALDTIYRCARSTRGS